MGQQLECHLLSVALLSDRCVNRYNRTRKTPCELWWHPALPLSTQQLSERPRGIRVVIYNLKIVTLPSPTPLVCIKDSSIFFSSKPLFTLLTSDDTPIGVVQDKDIYKKEVGSNVCVCYREEVIISGF